MTISVIQEKASATFTNTANLTLVSPAFTVANCTPGSTIVVFVIYSGTTAPTSVIDSASQTYSLLKGTEDTTGPESLGMYAFQNNQSSTKLTVTATWAASTSFTGIWVAEIGDGVSSASAHAAYQVSNANFQQSAPVTTGGLTTGNMTPTSQPCLFYGITMETGGAQSNQPSADTSAGFTAGISAWNLGAAPNLGISESQRLTSISPIAGLFTGNDASSNYLTIGAVYTEFSGGGGGTAPFTPFTQTQFFVTETIIQQ